MALAKINKNQCIRDYICVNECPAAVFVIGEDGFPLSDPAVESRCIQCGHCAAVCPKAALEWSGHDPLSLNPVLDFGAESSRVITAIRSRRTVRKFSPKPVSQQEINQVINSVSYAPSASNLRPVKLIHVDGRPALKDIASLTAAAITNIPGYGTFVKKWREGIDMITRGASSCVITYCDQSSPWGREDSAIAITYAEISAHALALGTCWGGLVVRASRENTGLKEYLGLNEEEIVTGVLYLGYPEVKFYRLPPREIPELRKIK